MALVPLPVSADARIVVFEDSTFCIFRLGATKSLTPYLRPFSARYVNEIHPGRTLHAVFSIFSMVELNSEFGQSRIGTPTMQMIDCKTGARHLSLSRSLSFSISLLFDRFFPK